MKRRDIDKAISFLKSKIKVLGINPNQIIMRADAFVRQLASNQGWSTKEASLITSILITNDILKYKGLFLLLSEDGYAVINGESSLYLRLNLNEIISYGPGKSPESVFYSIWEIVGPDQYENPFYVDGKTFFSIIRQFIKGLPPTYSQYTSFLQESGKSTARSIWCKDLFLSMPYEETGVFLQRISDEVNKRLKGSEDSDDYSLDTTTEIITPQIITLQNTEINSQSVQIPSKDKDRRREPKIFISHNSEDKAYAAALVNMLMGLGVNEEKSIFCSSVPGCGVAFGESFIDAIKNQYDNYELIVLFVHSPRFYQSPVSLCEMGAAWILKNRYWSFLTSDCQFEMLKGVVPSSELAFKAGQENTYPLLNDFKNFIETTFNLPSKSISRWDDIKKTFISAVSK